MKSNDINKLTQKHKKFMEKVDIFPYTLIMDNLKYERAHFYRLTSSLYGSFLFTPYDVSYEKIKSIFYSFILIEEYLKNKISKLNTFASNNGSNPYYDMRNMMKVHLLKNPDHQYIQYDIESFISSVDFVENSFLKVRGDYQKYQRICEEINRNKEFSIYQLEQLRRIVGECQACMFNQVAEQQKSLTPARKIIDYLLSVNDRNNDVEKLINQFNVLVEAKSEMNLNQSLNKFGNAEKNKSLSHEELIEEQIRLFEKDFYRALDEGFIKRRVRNPSVQEV
ncbi:hypothetical protein FGG79_20765 [Bacillus sp. BHET2]|uniref:hypothetical protein n=1 Tax=Bacillus sp. BHET2 TaxID=2583818 RepID=UPI00110D272D|nr:hypothetical protein [Bacillus sp. BHET2]TMU82716.1 hypothetical protein FGG79_20765 [Bacillus sp. BHET2]